MFKRVPILAGLILIVVLTVGVTAAFGGSKPPTLAQRVAALEAQVATLTDAVSVMQESQHQMLQGQALVPLDGTTSTILTIPGFGDVTMFVVGGTTPDVHFANTLSGETCDVWFWKLDVGIHAAYHVVEAPGDSRGLQGYHVHDGAGANVGEWFRFVVVRPGGHSATVEVCLNQAANGLPILAFATAEVR